MAEKPQPVRVLYCGVRSLLAEYSEFGPDFDKCKPWLIPKRTLPLPRSPRSVSEANEKEADTVSDKLHSTSISERTTLQVLNSREQE